MGNSFCKLPDYTCIQKNPDGTFTAIYEKRIQCECCMEWRKEIILEQAGTPEDAAINLFHRMEDYKLIKERLNDVWVKKEELYKEYLKKERL